MKDVSTPHFFLSNRLLEIVWSVLIDQLLSELQKASKPVRNRIFSYG